MIRVGMRSGMLILAIGAATQVAGCSKAKSALKDLAGISQLSGDEVKALEAQAGWDTTANPQLQNFNVIIGLELTDHFPGDLGKHVDQTLPFDLPSQADQTASNQRSMALLKATDFALPDGTKYTRFRIVSTARYDAANNKLTIDGDVVNQYLDDSQKIGKDHNNQAGKYLLVEGKGDKGLTYLSGAVQFKADGATDLKPVGDAMVFTTSSPFVTLSGTTSGKYFLAMLDGSKGSVIAYKGDIVSVENAPGTPTAASKVIAYAGALDQYKTGVTAKADALGDAEVAQKTATEFDAINGKVSDFIGGWKIIATDLTFVQPPQAAPTPPPAPATPPAAQPAPATPPAANDVVVRRELNPTGDDLNYNVDLGCSGYKEDHQTKIDMVRTGKDFDTYSADVQGWRATGDVRYSWDLATVIFPKPTDTANYLDGDATGYCLLTTGDQMYQRTKAAGTAQAAYAPGPSGQGMSSEMWQKVKVPSEAKSIQVRVAFFSTEFPKFVGTQYNDSFFVKFDESPDVIAAGNLNDLAGIKSTDQATVDAVKACSTTLTSYQAGKTCGDWMFVKDLSGMNGELWDIADSSTTPSKVKDAAGAVQNWGDTWSCLAGTAGDTNQKCYSGIIKPRIICKNLTDQDIGKVRTLRFNVSDVGDAIFDSALAVDSVVFSTKTCDDQTGRITTEADSRASML